MATEALVFFESQLTADELPRIPRRLVGECPVFRGLFESWGWPLDPARFQWSLPFADDRWTHTTAAEQWHSGRTVNLFGPGGHLNFGPGWLEWSSEVKWSWLFDGPSSRGELIEVSGQLAKVVGSDVGLVTGDWGADDNVLDVLEAGGTVRDAIAAVSGEGGLKTLQSIPFVEQGTYPPPSFGAYFLLRFP